jgi:hypothetical protein
VLTFGALIEDPAGFVTRLNDLLMSLATDTPQTPEPPETPQAPGTAAGAG